MVDRADGHSAEGANPESMSVLISKEVSHFFGGLPLFEHPEHEFNILASPDRSQLRHGKGHALIAVLAGSVSAIHCLSAGDD